jgi:hypothetical protein
MHKDLYLSLDRAWYYYIDSKYIPSGWVQVPVKINNNSKMVDSVIVAGSVGMSCSSSGAGNSRGADILDTLQPETSWWICERMTANSL